MQKDHPAESAAQIIQAAVKESQFTNPETKVEQTDMAKLLTRLNGHVLRYQIELFDLAVERSQTLKKIEAQLVEANKSLGTMKDGLLKVLQR